MDFTNILVWENSGLDSFKQQKMPGSSATSTITIGKGATLGTVLVFMMAVIGLSAPEAVILRKVLKWPLILTFFGVVAVGILLVGYLFNFIM